MTGPIAVEGAQAGQAIAITIEEIEVTTPGCVVVSRCEALSPADWWHEEDHVINLHVAGGQIALGEHWSVPVQPLIGCLATTPARETVLSRHEGDYGGNVDCGEITAGATVFLPVVVGARWQSARRGRPGHLTESGYRLGDRRRRRSARSPWPARRWRHPAAVR